MTHDDRKAGKVTLEDLIRLKKAERPPQEFWVKFERDLRAKQLAAIVEKRPWWYWVPPLMSKFSYLQVPLGATAVLAVTLLTVREYRSSADPTFSVQTISGQLVAQESSLNNGERMAQEDVGAELASTYDSFAGVSTPAVAAELAANTDDVSAAVGMALNGGDLSRAAQTISTPSSRAIQANLAAARASDGSIAEMIDGIHGFESRVMPENAHVEPLAQMQSPSQQRRTRILASALPAVSYGTESRGETRGVERVGRTLDDRLYDSISRMAVGGDRLTLKF